jgi:hypothetical protein
MFTPDKQPCMILIWFWNLNNPSVRPSPYLSMFHFMNKHYLKYTYPYFCVYVPLFFSCVCCLCIADHSSTHCQQGKFNWCVWRKRPPCLEHCDHSYVGLRSFVDLDERGNYKEIIWMQGQQQTQFQIRWVQAHLSHQKICRNSPLFTCVLWRVH